MKKLQQCSAAGGASFSAGEAASENASTCREPRGDNTAEAAVIRGRQSNHGAFHLPPCLEHLKMASPPRLYMAVAWWGLFRGKAFTREDIAQVFRVTPRRAGDVMTYLATAVSADVVKLEKRVVREGSGHSVLYMTVHHVAEDPPPRPPRKKPVPKKPSRKRSARDALAEARNLFLFQRAGRPAG